MNAGITINKYSLNFSDIEIEKRFNHEYLQKTKIYFRWGVLISILLYNGFHVFDYRFNQHDFWVLVTDRILMITSAAIFFIFAFTKHYEKLFDALLSMLFLTVGLGTVGVIYIDPNVIHTFYPVAVFFTLIPKISLRKAIVINLINTTALAIVLLLFSDIETENAFLQSFLAFSTTLVAIMVLYIKIKTEKVSFLKSLRLEEQFEELQDTEKELRQYNEEFQTIFEDLEFRKKELDKANKTLSSTNLELDTANKEILAGINYASLIQKSMLTSEDIINTYLSEYFLIFKPKEIVSGDFYYVNKIENHLIIAVADCTGHGVSGAFISMLGITYIHDTITRKETNSTNTVLEIVRERFKQTFKTFGSDSKNGMDMALCAINLDTLVLQYSGANLPLWIVRNGDLIEQKPTRCPIGFYPVDIDFQQNEIQLEKNDTIYMFSDGIYDQLSDINFKKYQKNKFRTLILENTTLRKSKTKNY